MKTIAFFNNKGGVGKTSLVYHIAHMLSDLGVKTLAVDLDPQANLTSMFLDVSRLEELWPDGDHPDTVYGSIQPILKGVGDIVEKPHVEEVTPNLGLLPGDLGLSRFEDKLSEAWPNCFRGDESAFRTITAFHRIVRKAAGGKYEVALIDVGPNLGAINRAALIASQKVVIPLAPDLFSLQGLKNLGPSLKSWKTEWDDMLKKSPSGLSVPSGEMTPLGYIVMQFGIRDSQPVKAYERFMKLIPKVYSEAVLAVEPPACSTDDVLKDSNNLALLKHYRSLMPLAMEAHKPIFHLKSADGAFGSHVEAVRNCQDDFSVLTEKIAERAGISTASATRLLPI